MSWKVGKFKFFTVNDSLTITKYGGQYIKKKYFGAAYSLVYFRCCFAGGGRVSV